VADPPPPPRGPRAGVSLPLPPPGDEESRSGVRMSALIADHTARAVPALPLGQAWELDDTTDEDQLLDSGAVRMADEPAPPGAQTRAARATVAGVRSRKLPLTADESAPVPLLPEIDPAPRLPAPPVAAPPRLPEPPRGPELRPADLAGLDPREKRLPLRAGPNTPPGGNLLPRLSHQVPRAEPPLVPPPPTRPVPGRGPAPRAAEARSAEPRSPRAEPRSGEPRSGEPRSAEPRPGEPRSGEPRSGEPRTADPRPPRAAPRAVDERAERSGPRPAPARADARAEGRPPESDSAKVRLGPRAPVTAGHVIAGRYQILDRIGVGGMGKVYKVRHTQLAKTFALKVIGENLADTDEARELFYREARLASAVNHPNITSVVDFGEDPDVGAFMVMELVEGEAVHRVLRRETRLGVRMACEIILQVADALHYIHSQGIVHCDIKTENILLAEQPGTKRRQIVVKLLDFGLARSLTGGRGSGPLSGTPHYVAPERIRGDAATPASDLYALGILFYELVTGHVPWDGAVSSILSGHLDQQPTPPSQVVSGLDPALETLILRALAKTPAERHKDMAAFIYELRTVMDMLGFGHRRRGGGKRVVIERSKNERDALAARVVDGCRLPLALISRDGTILVANPACARFVMGMVVEIEGIPLTSTPLAGAWRSLEADLARAAAASPIRRILEIDVPNSAPQRLLVWLDPCGDAVLLGVQPIDA
jgi:tRNA A-37 threonylcarbamoyl transferase component Bud32